jgi:hypothetical protein
MDFNSIVEPLKENFIPVKLTKEETDKIDRFIDKLIEYKQTEIHHQIDGGQEKKRFTTGLYGEMALSKFLGIDIIDWDIGKSAKFHNPDINGYNVGVKTVEWGKFPIVFKNSYYPEVICIKDKDDPSKIYICGIATPDNIAEHQSEDLILSSNLKARGTKTGFYGFEDLWELNSLNDLRFWKKKKK